MRGICTKKIGAISQLGAEKITFPPKPDIQRYIQTDGRTDVCFYRVALLLKNENSKIEQKKINRIQKLIGMPRKLRVFQQN